MKTGIHKGAGKSGGTSAEAETSRREGVRVIEGIEGLEGPCSSRSRRLPDLPAGRLLPL